MSDKGILHNVFKYRLIIINRSEIMGKKKRIVIPISKDVIMVIEEETKTLEDVLDEIFGLIGEKKPLEREPFEEVKEC